MDKNLNWKSELLRISQILKQNGIEITNIPTKGTKNGERYFIELKDISVEGNNIESIINLNKLDSKFPIGKYINRFRRNI